MQKELKELQNSVEGMLRGKYVVDIALVSKRLRALSSAIEAAEPPLQSDVCPQCCGDGGRKLAIGNSICLSCGGSGTRR